MSEFCSQCSPSFYDWDLFDLTLELENQRSEGFIFRKPYRSTHRFSCAGL